MLMRKSASGQLFFVYHFYVCVAAEIIFFEVNFGISQELRVGS